MIKDKDGKPINVVFDFGVIEEVEESVGTNLLMEGATSAKALKALMLSAAKRGGSNVDAEFISRMSFGDIDKLSSLVHAEWDKSMPDKKPSKNVKRQN